MLALSQHRSGVFEFEINQSLLVDPPLLVQGLHQRLALAGIFLPALQRFRKAVPGLSKFAGGLGSAPVGCLDYCRFERLLGAQVAVGNRPHVVQRFD